MSQQCAGNYRVLCTINIIDMLAFNDCDHYFCKPVDWQYSFNIIAMNYSQNRTLPGCLLENSWRHYPPILFIKNKITILLNNDDEMISLAEEYCYVIYILILGSLIFGCVFKREVCVSYCR